jgi:hypothetical protein
MQCKTAASPSQARPPGQKKAHPQVRLQYWFTFPATRSMPAAHIKRVSPPNYFSGNWITAFLCHSSNRYIFTTVFGLALHRYGAEDASS